MRVQKLLHHFILFEMKKRIEGASGKEIAEEVKRITSDCFKPSAGILYPILREMERKGQIRSELKKETSRGRREIVYKITGKGARDLEKIRKKKGDLFLRNTRRIVPLMVRVYGHEEMAGVMERFFELRGKVIGLDRERRKKAAELLMHEMERIERKLETI